MKFENMVLYYKPTCPYCHMVINFMEDNNIEMEMKDVTVPANLDELVDINGKTQVPCLVVKGEPMLESKDIIEYLKSYLQRELER